MEILLKLSMRKVKATIKKNVWETRSSYFCMHSDDDVESCIDEGLLQCQRKSSRLRRNQAHQTTSGQKPFI